MKAGRGEVVARPKLYGRGRSDTRRWVSIRPPRRSCHATASDPGSIQKVVVDAPHLSKSDVETEQLPGLGRHKRLGVMSCNASIGALPLPNQPPNAIHSIVDSMQKQVQTLTQLWKSFLPMCALFSMMVFINTIMSALAMTLVVTSPGGGPHVLPYLNVYAALPMSLLFMVAYAFISQRLRRHQVFRVIISGFAIFNLIFALFVYPNHGAVHLHGTADILSKVLPSGFGGAIGMIRNWTFSLFFCVSELWGDAALSLLFWGFANEITNRDDAPVLYPLIGVGANLAQILAGVVLHGKLSHGLDFTSALQSLLFLVVGCAVAVLLLHSLIAHRAQTAKKSAIYGPLPGQREMARNRSNGNVLEHRQHMMHASSAECERDVPAGDKKNDEKPPKLSFIDACKMLMKMPEIRALGTITVCQSLAVNLMEFVWNSHLKLVYPTAAAYATFIGDVSTATGFVAILLMLVSPVLFDQLGWGKVASITPAIMQMGGVSFFIAGIGYHVLNRMGMISVAHNMLLLTVLGGTLLHVLSRGVKFSLFKPAEEMVYITLDDESQTKGKAAIDVVVTQTGKAGGSLLQQCLLLVSGGALLYITPIIFAVYSCMLTAWKQAVHDLATEQDAMASKNTTTLL